MLDPVCGGVVTLNGRLYGTGYSDDRLTLLLTGIQEKRYMQ